jgi:ABC-type nitrate/sulfonate/bicarbonate transport system permease component
MTHEHPHAPYPFFRHASWWPVAGGALVIGIPLALLWSFSRIAHISLASLSGDIGASLVRIAIAFFIAAVLGWLVALLLTHGRLGELLLPVFDLLQSLPAFALLPIAVLYLGRDTMTVIIFLVLAIIWPIIFSTVSSIKHVNRNIEGAVAMTRIHGFHYFRYYLIPLSLPGFVTGSVIGLGEGWEALIATEIIVATRSGVGSFFTTVASDPLLTAFGVLLVLSIVFAVNKLIWLPLLNWSHRLAL